MKLLFCPCLCGAPYKEVTARAWAAQGAGSTGCRCHLLEGGESAHSIFWEGFAFLPSPQEPRSSDGAWWWRPTSGPVRLLPAGCNHWPALSYSAGVCTNPSYAHRWGESRVASCRTPNRSSHCSLQLRPFIPRISLASPAHLPVPFRVTSPAATLQRGGSGTGNPGRWLWHLCTPSLGCPALLTHLPLCTQ